jgi:lysozyme family protein
VIAEIIALEGGYSNDPADSGGPTMFGITQEVAKANGYDGPMEDLPREIAEQIYGARYWDSVGGDAVANLSKLLVLELVDTAVNMGPGRAGKFLQRSLNVLNRKGKLFPDIKVDGDIGPGTLGALAAYLLTRDDATLTKAVNCLQGAFYIALCERREKDERFVYGWLKNRVKL